MKASARTETAIKATLTIPTVVENMPERSGKTASTPPITLSSMHSTNVTLAPSFPLGLPVQTNAVRSRQYPNAVGFGRYIIHQVCNWEIAFLRSIAVEIAVAGL